MTSTLVMADMSEIAPLVESDGVTVLAFYVGGDTPNVPLISTVKALKTPYLLPIWTRSDPQDASVTTDAQEAIRHLGLIGAPKGTLVGLDYETAVDSRWVEDFNAILGAAGYLVILYASEANIDENYKPAGGYWSADWTGKPHLVQDTVATQYASADQAGRPYDLSLILADAPLWHAVSTPVIVPGDPTVTRLQEELNETGARLLADGVKGQLTKAAFTRFENGYGVIVEGNGGPAVRVLQAMLNTWHSVVTTPALTVDGDFGSKTLAAVETFQVKRNVADSVVNGRGDGRVGPSTKAALAV